MAVVTPGQRDILRAARAAFPLLTGATATMNIATGEWTVILYFVGTGPDRTLTAENKAALIEKLAKEGAAHAT